MDVATKIQVKLKKMLKRLKDLGIIKTFTLEINFFPIKKNLIKSLIEIDSVLKKCLRTVVTKPRRAEIRNVLTELVRIKNLNDAFVEEKVIDKSDCFNKLTNKDVATVAFNFQCEICNQTFSSKKNFVSHQKLHGRSKTYLCEKCGAVLHTVKKWQKHSKGHDMETRFYLSMGHCKFSQRNDKKQKEESSEMTLEIVKSKSTASQLSSKSLSMSENEFKNLVVSKSVENVKLTEEKKFTCTCGKVFRIWESLKKHEKLKHTFTVTNYNCQNCEKCFREKGKLNRHMLSHKDSQYCCSVCSKLFSRSDTLKRHLSICHHISKEFYCSFCQKKFKLKYNKDIHEENIHKNLNHWIQCEHCGKKFKNKITFRSHRKIHLNNGITCTVCGKSFARKVYCENHMKSKHFPHQTSSGAVSHCVRASQ